MPNPGRILTLALCLFTLAGATKLSAQMTVVDAGTTNIFTANAAATNFLWTLNGLAVGGNSNSYAYRPQSFDVGTHYLLAVQTLPGGINSNSYWGVRVRIPLTVSGTNFYVATNGSDSNPGTLAAPFKTLEKARDTVRALARPLPTGGVTVWLRGGIFYRTNTLMLTSVSDSGTATAPIVWRGYSNEVAVVSGGKSIGASAWTPLNSTQTNRVPAGVNPTNIWEMDVTAAGLVRATNFPAEFSQWTTFNVYSQGNDGGLGELFYNGRRQFLSRYPNHSLVNDDLYTTNMLMDGIAQGRVTSGTTLNYSGDSTNYLNYPGTYTNSSGQAVAVGGAFLCKSNDIARFTRWQAALTNGGLWLQGYWRVPWQIDGLKVIGFDVTNRAVLFATNATAQNGIASKYARPNGYKTEPYWALNLLEEMDQPGEWAVDFNRKKIYFYAPGPLTNADGAVVISDFGSPLVQVGSTASLIVSNVVFQSLNFEAGLAQGIVISNSVRNLVVGCNFRNMGNMSVDLVNGGTNGVVSCNLSDLAGGGILMRGGIENSNAALRVPTRNFVVNNVVTNFSRAVRVYAAAVDAGFYGPISGGGGGHYACVGTRVAHNDISVSPHSAVLHASWDNVFEYNEIANFQQVSDDLGAFYSYDYSYQHGNQTFRYNFIHDSPYGNGIDFDQDSLAMSIYGNVMNLNTVPAESQGYGVVYHDYNQDIPGREQYAINYNNLYANTHVGAKYVSPLPAVIEGNAAINCISNDFTWRLVTLGVTTNTLSNSSQAVMQSALNTNYLFDPGFVSLTNNDMRLKPDSRVYTDLPTFKQIPVELIGLYNDEFRTNAGGWSPLVTTSNILTFTATNALCGGRLYFPQFESNTTVMVYYGHTDGGTNPAAWLASTNFGVFPAGAVNLLVSGLDPYTTYYFRYFATNAFGSSWSTASVGINLPPPPAGAVFVNLTPNLAVLSNSLVTFSGQVVGSGPSFPTNGEGITVTINGITQNGVITNNTGNFSMVFNSAGIAPSVVPYPVSYAYAGTTNIGGATNTTTTLAIMPGNIIWSGTSDTDFENGGTGRNWTDYPAPVSDLVSCTAIFGNVPTSNQPSLTTSRAVKGLTFTATNGGWSLGSGSTNFVLGIGAGGITTAGQTNGTNFVNASLNVGANQTWQAGTGGNLLITGSVTNANSTTNYSLTINGAGNTGNIILSPAAGNSVSLVGSNYSVSVLQLKSGGVLQLGGDGVTALTTASSNTIQNTASGASAYGTWAINNSGRLQVNSGTWVTGDVGKNGGDGLTGTIDVRGGLLSFTGARYLGAGTINVSAGTLKVTCVGSGFVNGGRFSLGAITNGSPNVGAMNITGGLVDVAQANGGNSIGSFISTLINQSGGVFQNAVTIGGGVNGGSATSFAIGGTGTTNNLSAFTLTGGVFISAGSLQAAGAPGPGSMNNFNFMGGTLAVAAYTGANLGSSPTATAVANQTNGSFAIGTLANYGGELAPGNLGVPGRTSIAGNYAVSNAAAALTIDIGGTNQANAFQNGSTNYDFVSVSGSTTLGGSLNVSLLNGFVPAATNSFTILTNGGTLSGNFANLVGGRVAVATVPGGSFRMVTNPTSVVLSNYVLLAASFTAGTNSGTAPLTVTFTDTSTGLITNRFWNFGDGFTTNTTATSVIHMFTTPATNLVTLIVSDALATSTNSLTVTVSGPSSPPIIGGISVSGTNIIITGTNGSAGANYLLLGSTNVALPATNWTILSTNQFGPGGSVNVTNPMDPAAPQTFYRLLLP